MPSPDEISIRIRAQYTDGLITVTPLDALALATLDRILHAGPDSLIWHFHGSRYTDLSKSRFIGASFTCGGEHKRVTENNWTESRHLGGIDIFLDLSEDTEDNARWAIRDMGYFGSGFHVMEGSTLEAFVLACKANCKVCSGSLSGGALEWRVCSACCEICEHDYVEGVGHTGSNLAVMPYCTKCGRGHPDWKPSEDPVEDLAKVLTSGGIDALLIQHEGGGSTLLTRK